MIGGRITAEAAGIKVPNRDEIYQRIRALPEGSIFRAEDIINGDSYLTSDFAQLRDFDYVHLYDGNLVGIVETPFLRMLPKLPLLLESYASREACALIETGDWIAYRKKIKQWEPILGHRFYTDGRTRVISFGRSMKIQFIKSPSWLLRDTESDRNFRAFYDTPPKEMMDSIERAMREAHFSKADILEIAAYARAVSTDDYTEEDREDGLADPAFTAGLIESNIRELEERSKNRKFGSGL